MIWNEIKCKEALCTRFKVGRVYYASEHWVKETKKRMWKVYETKPTAEDINNDKTFNHKISIEGGRKHFTVLRRWENGLQVK